MSPSKVSSVDFESFTNTVNAKGRNSKQIHHGINPATGEELWECPIASEQDLDDAVAAAKEAFASWRNVPVEKRKELLLKFADLFGNYTEEFISLLCKESGKPVSLSLGWIVLEP